MDCRDRNLILADFLKQHELSTSRQITIDEIIATTLVGLRPETQRGMRQRMDSEPRWAAFRGQLQPRDLVYLCTSPQWTWGASMCGREWIVIVRSDEVVGQYLWRMC